MACNISRPTTARRQPPTHTPTPPHMHAPQLIAGHRPQLPLQDLQLLGVEPIKPAGAWAVLREGVQCGVV